LWMGCLGLTSAQMCFDYTLLHIHFEVKPANGPI
jgi:hypothetical protein